MVVSLQDPCVPREPGLAQCGVYGGHRSQGGGLVCQEIYVDPAWGTGDVWGALHQVYHCWLLGTPSSGVSATQLCQPCSATSALFHPVLTKVPFLWQEEFRLERGPQLLALVEDAFSRQADGLQDRWLISLSKPNENDKHLLMTLAGEQGKCGEKEPSHDGKCI